MSEPITIDDRRVRAIGIPAFGLAIPHVAGLFGPLSPSDAAWWLGHAWFVLLAAAIWQGNRVALFRLRRQWGWLDKPRQKLVLLVLATLFFTVPVTVVALALWYGAVFGVVDLDAVRTVSLINVICVLFVTHAYETVFLIKEREDDLLSLERLDRARAEAEADALRAQLDPHFMFNALNTLSWLVERDPAQARAFTEDLGRVYRYVLRHREADLVPLSEELEFLDRWFNLLRVRFGEALALDVSGPVSGCLVPPLAVQTLVENAVKHNGYSERHPLPVSVCVVDDDLVVDHPRRPRRTARPGAGVGLANLDERCRLATGRGIEVGDEPTRFTVRLPMVREAEQCAS